ncbi:MAG: peroxiredoxin-like family protein [Bacteroidota bacterium]
MKSFSLLLFMGIFLISCSSSEQADQKPSEAATQKTQQVKAADSNLAKLGIDTQADNQLGGLELGTLAPDIVAKDQNGEDFKLKTSLEEGPVVLIFYRGYWCGYCNQQLAAFEEELDQLKAKGARVVAISPESTEYAKMTEEKTGSSVSIISDGDQSIMKSYKVAFQVTQDYQDKVKNFVKKGLTEMSNNSAATLPVPATYIIGKDGKISYRFYDPDYSKRASVNDIIAAL